MIDTAMSSSIQPACGLANGSISGLRIIDGEYAETKWVNDQGHLFEGGTNGTYSWLNDLPAGRYRLIVTDQRSGCADTSRYYLLQNQSGPSFQDGSVQITPATCGSQTGSITGIAVSNTSGEPHLWWLDSTGKVVGNTFNLQRVPPGKYRLKYKDVHPCDTIITPYYVVGNTGAIAIDTAGKIISPAKCSGGGGSIRGIKVSGGSNFQWKNTVTNAVVATSLNVFDLPAGSYQLTVTNQQECIQTSPVITIPQAAFIPIQILSSRTVPASCGQPNGFVEINVFSRDTGLYAFRWVDSASGQVISRFTNLYQINNGHYELFARDSNGCEQEILDVLMFGTPIPDFDYTRMNITPDRCLTGAGAIEGIVVRNLASGPTVYEWVNSSGDTVGRTLNIRNLPQGSYRLRVNNGGCNVESQPVAVGNVNATLPAPQYDEQTILKNTSATLTVKNTQSGTYQLFNNPAGTTPMQLNTTGIFTTPPLTADQQFYVRFVNGVCSSALASVWIKVVDKNAVYVPTVFSPNADGKNDVLKAIPVGRVKLVQFVVYNRWGEVVFSTTNFSKGWNGTHLGVPAETGVYVWMLRAVDELKGAPIEQKGTVMIIR
jgi:gliding motility-associated-like protein